MNISTPRKGDSSFPFPVVPLARRHGILRPCGGTGLYEGYGMAGGRGACCNHRSRFLSGLWSSCPEAPEFGDAVVYEAGDGYDEGVGVYESGDLLVTSVGSGTTERKEVSLSTSRRY